MNRTAFLLYYLALNILGVCSAQEPNNGRRVMTWVPPYAVDECRKRLDQSFDGVGLKDGLTHVGLQFWHPTKDGGLKFVEGFKPINDETVSNFRKWGSAHGVRTMLCVYNGTPEGWDWELAKSAFETHRERLIETLVSETLRLELDGVDIDFEGNGNREGDRVAFVRFIKELSERLHAEGKELTVDTFAYKWHAPNQGWWAALLPHLDGLHVMGYSETGAGAADWRSYDFMKAAAGEHSSRLLFGMLSSVPKWQEKPASEQVAWVDADATVGLAIWDARLRAPVWRSQEMWQAVARIKGGSEPVVPVQD